MWSKAYNSELPEETCDEKGPRLKKLTRLVLQPKNSQTHVDMRPGAKQNDNSYKTSLL